MNITLSPAHGLVLANVLGSYVVHHIVMSFRVGAARKKYGVKYPTMYADSSNANAEAFNCVQRGHQNSLENQPAFLTMLLVAGLRYPLSASVAGALYLIGRLFYFRGYCTGNPNGRHRGGFMYFGTLALLGMVGRFAWELFTSA